MIEPSRKTNRKRVRAQSSLWKKCPKARTPTLSISRQEKPSRWTICLGNWTTSPITGRTSSRGSGRTKDRAIINSNGGTGASLTWLLTDRLPTPATKSLKKFRRRIDLTNNSLNLEVVHEQLLKFQGAKSSPRPSRTWIQSTSQWANSISQSGRNLKSRARISGFRWSLCSFPRCPKLTRLIWRKVGKLKGSFTPTRRGRW
jgi:hypothetical protein